MGGTREERFEEIVARWQPALRRLCAGCERDEGLREDLFQEILLAIWRALPSFRAESSLRTWVFKVAHNVSCRHVGRCAKERLTGLAPAEWVQGTIGEGPEETCEERRLADRLGELIRRLGPVDRQIILMYLEELPQGEIADVTGLTLENVSTRVHRIKGALAAGMIGRSR